MLGHDLAIAHADGPGGLDEFGLLEGQHLSTGQAGDRHPADEADGDEDEEQPVESLPERGLAECDRQQDDEQDVREGIDDVGDAHQEVVRATTVPAGQRTDRHADEDDDGLDHERDGDADPRPVEQTAEQVTAELVGPEDVAGGERWQRAVAVGEDRLEILLLVRPRCDERADDPAEQQSDHEEQADHGQLVLGQPPEGLPPQAGRAIGFAALAWTAVVFVAISPDS